MHEAEVLQTKACPAETETMTLSNFMLCTLGEEDCLHAGNFLISWKVLWGEAGCIWKEH